MFSSYGKLCRQVYDFTKPVGSSINGDIEYYLQRINGVKGAILEPAVGSGRFIIPLLEKGYQVEGIDNSSVMLEACRKECLARDLSPKLYQGDMSKEDLVKKYEMIVIPTGSFMLIEDRQSAWQALNNFYRLLEPGGRLIMDLSFPYDFVAGKSNTSTFEIEDSVVTMESKSIKMDWLKQQTVSYLKYEKWQHGQLIDTELQRFALNWYGIEEFKLMLTQVGFKSITCSANYTFGKEPETESDLLTFEATR